MSPKASFPRDTIEQATLTAKGWGEMEGRLTVPSLSFKEFLNKVAEVKQCIDKAEELRIKRSVAIAERNRALKEVWDCTKRIRNAAKATFGDDSAEVEKMGVVPVSSRRRKGSL